MAARPARLTSVKTPAARRRVAPATAVHSVSLIGFGNWGTALALALRDAGIPIREVILRPSSSTVRSADRKLVRALGATLTGLEQSTLDAELIWICTPDAAIAAVASQLANHMQKLARPRGKKPVIFHSSGALDSLELAACKAEGASVASVHPLMTFPQRSRSAALQTTRQNVSLRQNPSLAGVPFAVEGDRSACRLARSLVSVLHGVVFSLPTTSKPLYHAFGTLASPLLIAQLTAIMEAAVAAGYTRQQGRRLMRPIVERTVVNFFANGPEGSFSGPLARGDVATIARHLSALEKYPGLAETYRQLARYALENLPGKKKEQLRHLLSGQDEKPASSSPSIASTA